jgi:CRP-like cAMP-binding protein
MTQAPHYADFPPGQPPIIPLASRGDFREICRGGRKVPNVTNPLVRKLLWHGELSEAERTVLENMVERTRDVAAGEDLVREGDKPANSILLLQGFAARYSLVDDGRRQIVAIHVSGDFVDLHSFVLKTMDHSVGTLTRCRVAHVPHEFLNAITERLPHLTRLLWLDTLVDAATHRVWMVGMGRRSALEQLAHLVCELYVRLEVIGQVDGAGFDLPLTQTDLGDALGLSLVHVNRTVRELRQAGLVAWRGSRVTIQDWPKLVELAQFDPTYLHLNREGG